MKPKYCILVEEWFALADAQGWRCAICWCPIYNGTESPEPHVGKAAHVDHSHAVEDYLNLLPGINPVLALRRSIRGLLCPECNHLLSSHLRTHAPGLCENLAKARRAADYLEASTLYQTQELLCPSVPPSLDPTRVRTKPSFAVSLRD